MRVYLVPVLVVALAAVVGCDLLKRKPTTPSTQAEKVDDRNTNFRPDASTLKNAVQAGKRAVQLHDFQQLGTIIVALDLQNNKMPTKDEIVADLQGNPEARDLLKKINEGVIILTGSTDRQGLWMYEVDADKAGGIVYWGGRAERATADQVKQLLGKQ